MENQPIFIEKERNSSQLVLQFFRNEFSFIKTKLEIP